MLRASVLLLGLCMVLASVARADDKEAARASYQSGKRHYDLGEYREALADFRSSYLASEDPSILFNIGQCYRQLGDKAEAVRSYRSFLRNLPAAENAPQVERLIATLEAAIADEQRKRDDARPAPVAPAPTTMTPTAPTTATASAPASHGKAMVIGGAVVAGAGLALLAGGIASGVLAQQAGDTVTNESSMGTRFDPQQQTNGQLDQSLMIALSIIGGAAIVTGVVVAVVGARRSRRIPRGALLVPMAPSSRGVAVEARF